MIFEKKYYIIQDLFLDRIFEVLSFLVSIGGVPLRGRAFVNGASLAVSTLWASIPNAGFVKRVALGRQPHVLRSIRLWPSASRLEVCTKLVFIAAKARAAIKPFGRVAVRRRNSHRNKEGSCRFH